MKEQKVKLDGERVRQKIEQLAAAYENPAELMEWYYKKKDLLANVQAAVLEEQVVEKLLEQAEVVEKRSSYDEVMNFKPSDTGANS